MLHLFSSADDKLPMDDVKMFISAVGIHNYVHSLTLKLITCTADFDIPEIYLVQLIDRLTFALKKSGNCRDLSSAQAHEIL